MSLAEAVTVSLVCSATVWDGTGLNEGGTLLTVTVVVVKPGPLSLSVTVMVAV